MYACMCVYIGWNLYSKSNCYSERPRGLTMEKFKSFTGQKIKSPSVQLKDLELTNMIYLHLLYETKVKLLKNMQINFLNDKPLGKRAKAMKKWFTGIKEVIKIYSTLLVVREI